MICVTMVDTFFSGWGPCDGKLNIFMVHCANQEQAEIIAAAGKDMAEMRSVNIRQCDTKPYYDQGRYLVSEKNFSDMGRLWTEDRRS